VSTGQTGRTGPGWLRRRVTTGALIIVAVIVAAGVMATLSTQAIMASASCAEHPALVNVAVAEDIAPSVQKVAQYFNRLHREINGKCAEVQVTEEQPATAAAIVDGQAPSGGLPAIDAWIPDSSLWVNQARALPAGARTVQPTGISVARSPLMIVMPQSVASSLGTLSKRIGWNFLLPESAGGPPAADGIKVELPDPKQSAAGLATVIQLNRTLGSGLQAQENFTRFAFGAEETSAYDNPTALTSLIALSRPPLNERTVTVASEQSVVQFDQAHRSEPLAARYPSDGSPDLDYPYTLTTTDRLKLKAARQFGQILRQPYAAAVMQWNGFRSAHGKADATPSSFGLSGQAMSPASLGSPSLATVTLQGWDKVRIGIRILVMIDTSGSMAATTGPRGPTLETELLGAAGAGLQLFPDSTVMGLWEFSNDLNGSKPYKSLVPVGPLPAEVGLITRRAQIQALNATVAPHPGTTTKLNASILAAYKYMVKTYDPRYSNTVVVMTGGQDNAPGDISNASLLRQVQKMNTPAHHVGLLFDVFGNPSDLPFIKQLAKSTSGGEFTITDPSEINKVFFVSVGRSLAR
jgi:hypothetical protein